ncbi:hypothetical protein GCM10010922_00400 [Microbacterium sorbitolivorans]|uniref:YdcF family protein n=1 Tax=Microbacterium sorbitolivorans TaxID=1867410 RepID=A0A367Y7B6_9MICO|nr:YdcF family protein [Microbacterium sorbitolivorans]RCK61763.1 YdcF family protein [Microbacterium sorbitolivorans]GGF29333.1 hypothetical protein GCM10010922_00400 [Microbacterium sorbitolivorans]
MLSLALGVVFAVLYAIYRDKDPRLLRNGVFLTAAVAFGVLGVLLIAAPHSIVAALLLGLIGLAVPVSILVFGIGLIRNGFTMMKKEGRSLGNRLSLLLGIAVLALPLISIVLVMTLQLAGLLVATLIAFVSAYASMAFISFAVYSVVYGRMRHRIDPVAIVVHGSGLAGGRVTPLLRGRLDRGIQAHHAEFSRGNRVPMVPSGGQGSDESRSEGEAMAEYLREQGVPAELILPETRSTTTAENIRMSTELLAKRGAPGPILLVTSDYHVLRTASLARRMGIEAQVVGSRTARYYVPSAFIREFIALIVENRWVSVVALLPFCALLVTLAISVLTLG